MKFLLATIALIATGAAGTGLVCYRLNCNPALRVAAAQGDAMAWLRADFHLTDAQFAAISQLHDSYAPSCEEHCRLIREATKARDMINVANASNARAFAEADQKLRELRAACETTLTAQLRQVAALMSPEDGQRYLALLLPKVAGYDHAAAPDLQLNQH